MIKKAGFQNHHSSPMILRKRFAILSNELQYFRFYHRGVSQNVYLEHCRTNAMNSFIDIVEFY